MKIDALGYRFGPVRAPDFDAEETGAGKSSVKHLFRDIVFERYRLGLSHPNKHNTEQFGGRIFACLQFPDEVRIWALDRKSVV